MEKAGASSTTRRLRSNAKPKNGADKVESAKTKKIVGDKATNKKNKEIEHCDGDEYPRNKSFRNELIMENIFSFLTLEDIKQFRLVCTKWNNYSIPFVEKMSTIVVGPPGNKTAAGERSPTTFNDLFKNSGINFRAFKLKTLPIPSAKWSRADLVGFLENQMQNISKLSIDKIRVREFNPDSEDCFFLDPHISNHLSLLAFDNSGSCSTKFSISSDKLTSAQSLSFRKCEIHFVENCKLRPKKLEINDNVKAMENGKLIKVLILDEYFYFDKLLDLTLRVPHCIFKDSDSCYTKFSINLATGNISLKNLVLEFVRVENLSACKWKIQGNFKLRGVAFERRSQMKFTELDFGRANISMDALPESIEKLTLDRGWSNMSVFSPTLSTFPNLKYLELSTTARESPAMRWNNNRIQIPENLFACLSYFTQCQNLKTVKLVSQKGAGRVEPIHLLNTNWIPSSVENICLSGRIRAEGVQVRIRKLLIDNFQAQFSGQFDLPSLTGISRLLKSEQLILNFNLRKINFSEVEELILTLIQSSPYNILAFGPLETKVTAFNKSTFSKHVDKMSRHYLFTNKKGKSITAQQFKKLVEQHHDNERLFFSSKYI